MNAPGNRKKNTESDEVADSNAPSEKIAGTPRTAESSGACSPEAVSSSLKLPHLLFIAPLIAAADQIVKTIVVRRLYLHESITVIPDILSLTRIHNSGIAFGLFPDMSDVFTVVNLISILAVLYFYLSVRPRGALLGIGCGLIMGGALGNLIDRFRLDYVVDYINFSFWPAFNVADMAVTSGVALLMIGFFREEKGPERDASDTA